MQTNPQFSENGDIGNFEASFPITRISGNVATRALITQDKRVSRYRCGLLLDFFAYAILSLSGKGLRRNRRSGFDVHFLDLL